MSTSLSVESGSDTVPKKDFKIHVVDGTDRKDSRWTFMGTDLRTLSDIECEVLQRRPELRLKKLNFYYYDKKYDKIQITNAKDFDVFFALQIDPNIFVSYTPRWSPRQRFFALTIYVLFVVFITYLYVRVVIVLGKIQGAARMYCDMYATSEECLEIADYIS